MRLHCALCLRKETLNLFQTPVGKAILPLHKTKFRQLGTFPYIALRISFKNSNKCTLVDLLVKEQRGHSFRLASHRPMVAAHRAQSEQPQRRHLRGRLQRQTSGVTVHSTEAE